jgi:hypothetical protein
MFVLEGTENIEKSSNPAPKKKGGPERAALKIPLSP